VQRTQRYHEIEGLVAERIGVLRAVPEQTVLHLGLGVGKAVLGHIEANDIRLGQAAA